ncbi:MAG TPA: protein kinase, partial [Polyangiales bacterium]|nr:protein kinase [Polyangiales bacterium]
MRVDEIESGKNVSGQYSLLEVMGDPGYEVFRARASDGRSVVLRFSRGRSQFETRAAIELCENAMRVRHPMLAEMYSCDRFDDGSLRLVSEFVAGRSLDAWLSATGIPPLPISVDFVRRVAMILQHAHGRGVTHHALYPANIVVLEPETRAGGRIAAKLLDLGVHRAMRGPTRFEAAHFMAPEALATELRAPTHALAIDVRMNVYSCGCLLHYLCTGELPYQSDSLQGLRTLHRTTRRRQSKLPAELEYVIERALEVDPKRRIPGMAELARALSYVESLWRSSSVRRRAAMPPPLPARPRQSEAPRLAPAIAAALALRPVPVKKQSASEPPPPLAADVP